jgi:hypothetical protein
MSLFRITALCFFVFFVAAASIIAQDERQRNASPNTSTQTRTTADETFVLNITERRITESNYEASTAVEIARRDDGVSVRVGVGFVAEQINVLLRNVSGQVRFRASLEPILRRINEHTGAAVVSPSP